MPPKKPVPAKKPAAGAAAKGGKKEPAKAAGAAAKGGKKEPATAAAKVPEKPYKEITIGQKQIAGTLIEDLTGEIGKDERAVLVIDNEINIAARFLPYSGANVLEVGSPSQMEPESLRKALMGAARFGKAMAIDFGDTGPDMLDSIRDKLDTIQKGLLQKCMNREICKREVYESLIKDTDDADLTVAKYQDFENDFSAKFIFMILMKHDEYPKDYTKQFFVVKIE